MKNFTADIVIMPHAELLDPQGKTVANNMKHLNIEGIEDVRIGKRVVISLQAESENEANEKVKTACEKLLANPIMEAYEYTLAISDN